jgi:carboxypeptidase C (cathepsin A)
VADFVRQFLRENRMWHRPIYLAGESYGTTRAALMSERLRGRGVEVSGIVLVSPVLSFLTTAPGNGNDLPYALFLPTYAATARYHGLVKGEAELGAFLEEVKAFAGTTYLVALARGDRLAGEERREVAERVAALTGLSVEFVLRSDLRVGPSAFRKELLRAQGKTVGRLDTRYVGTDRTDAGSRPGSDPSMEAIRGPYTAVLNQYVREVLGYDPDLVYHVFGDVHPWNMDAHRGRFVNVAGDLREAMASNPHLRVLCCFGYYDLATPYHAMEYTVSHMGLRAERRKNVRFAYYETGHMMYVRDVDRAKLRDDAARFYAEGGPGSRRGQDGD